MCLARVYLLNITPAVWHDMASIGNAIQRPMRVPQRGSLAWFLGHFFIVLGVEICPRLSHYICTIISCFYQNPSGDYWYTCTPSSWGGQVCISWEPLGRFSSFFHPLVANKLFIQGIYIIWPHISRPGHGIHIKCQPQATSWPYISAHDVYIFSPFAALESPLL